MNEFSKNELLYVDSKKIEEIKKNLKSNKDVFIVELNGENIQSWRDYISEIQKKFQFPTNCFDSVDRYLDWIRDLEWLNKESFVVIINSASSFLKDDAELKKQIISDYVDTILPFWQSEVQRVVVEGKRKTFMVYLVD